MLQTRPVSCFRYKVMHNRALALRLHHRYSAKQLLLLALATQQQKTASVRFASSFASDLKTSALCRYLRQPMSTDIHMNIALEAYGRDLQERLL